MHSKAIDRLVLIAVLSRQYPDLLVLRAAPYSSSIFCFERIQHEVPCSTGGTTNAALPLRQGMKRNVRVILSKFP
jgi:hypothetical protein